jgi:hypothetical protein
VVGVGVDVCVIDSFGTPAERICSNHVFVMTTHPPRHDADRLCRVKHTPKRMDPFSKKDIKLGDLKGGRHFIFHHFDARTHTHRLGPPSFHDLLFGADV